MTDLTERQPAPGPSSTGPRGFVKRNPRRIAAIVLLALAWVLWPGTLWAALLYSIESLIAISPMILLAIFLLAFVTASGAIALIATAFRGRQLRMIGLASLIGALTPVCGITVFPLIAGLLAARVPLAPIMAFWLASPITDPGMLAITAATLGLPFAIGKTLAALACGLLGGGATLAAVRLGWFKNPDRPNRLSRSVDCGCSTPQSLRWRFWQEAERRRSFVTAGLESGKLALFWLLLAFVAEYLMKSQLPQGWLIPLVGTQAWYSLPLAALVGMPIYLDGYAALPLIRGLIEGGMRPDAAMTFLVAGGITSAWAAIPVYSLVRLPIFLFYLVLAFLAAMLSGWGFGLFV